MTDLVIAYYKEKEALSTFAGYANSRNYNLKLYNKGGETPDLNSFIISKSLIDLPNIGQATHTYLNHIIENYDNLADTTIFITGSAFRDEKKARKARWLLSNANNCTGFMSQHIWTSDVEDYDFELPFYDIFDYSNSSIQANSKRVRTAMVRADVTPLGDWIRKHTSYKLNTKRFYRTNKCTFAVSRDLIQKKPVSFYKSLIKQLEHSDRNLEVIHFFERAWVCIFVDEGLDSAYYKKILNHDVPRYGDIR